MYLIWVYFHYSRELTLTNSPDAQSSSSAPFSQSFSPSHLHDNETHLLVAPPQSNFSGGHVCLPVGRNKRDREITAVVLWYHKGSNKNIYKTPLDLISITPTLHLKLIKLHHSGQLSLLSGLSLKIHAERSWNIANAQLAVKQKNNSAPLLLFLPICSSWHGVGLIQITLCLIWSMLLIIHLCLQCSLKPTGIKSKGQPTSQILYFFDFLFIILKNNGSQPLFITHTSTALADHTSL